MDPVTRSDDARISADMAERAERWASTMTGHELDPAAVAGTGEPIHLAHADSWAGSGSNLLLPRHAREEREGQLLATLATRSHDAGERAIDEEPDPWRTCFERDRDRIL
ncbi:MAG: hypothetical protein RJB65_1590, partial [Actinomycetota bacterium]